MRYDLHIHTIYSKYHFFGLDSLIKPRELIKTALRRNLDGIAVTDHNTVKGVDVCLKENRNLGNKLQIISGCEVSSQEGHILAYGLREWREKKILPAIEVVEKISDLGGISVAAHPFAFTFLKKSLNCVVEKLKLDGVEVLNFNSSKGANRKAMATATRLKIGRTAGSDAHVIFNVGKVATISNGDIIDEIAKNKTKVEGKEADFFRIIGTDSYRLSYILLKKATMGLF
jgi:predicted metal-dependent phosphoesterase TrpH